MHLRAPTMSSAILVHKAVNPGALVRQEISNRTLRQLMDRELSSDSEDTQISEFILSPSCPLESQNYSKHTHRRRHPVNQANGQSHCPHVHTRAHGALLTPPGQTWLLRPPGDGGFQHRSGGSCPRNMEHGTWGTEHETWNMKHGTWGHGIWDAERRT